jgi:hypothetical protein
MKVAKAMLIVKWEEEDSAEALLNLIKFLEKKGVSGWIVKMEIEE